MTAQVDSGSPIRRALRWTLVFIGPFALAMLTVEILLASLAHDDTAHSRLIAEAPHSWRLCLDHTYRTDPKNAAKIITRSYVIFPGVFSQPVVHAVAVHPTGETRYRRSRGALMTYFGGTCIALLMTACISLPAIAKLARPRSLPTPIPD